MSATKLPNLEESLNSIIIDFPNIIRDITREFIEKIVQDIQGLDENELIHLLSDICMYLDEDDLREQYQKKVTECSNAFNNGLKWTYDRFSISEEERPIVTGFRSAGSGFGVYLYPGSSSLVNISKRIIENDPSSTDLALELDRGLISISSGSAFSDIMKDIVSETIRNKALEIENFDDNDFVAVLKSLFEFLNKGREKKSKTLLNDGDLERLINGLRNVEQFRLTDPRNPDLKLTIAQYCFIAGVEETFHHKQYLHDPETFKEIYRIAESNPENHVVQKNNGDSTAYCNFPYEFEAGIVHRQAAHEEYGIGSSPASYKLLEAKYQKKEIVVESGFLPR